VVVVLLRQRQRVFSKPAISCYAEGIMATVEVQYASTALDHDGVDLGVVTGSTKDAQLETAQEYPSPDHVTNGSYSRASVPALTVWTSGLLVAGLVPVGFLGTHLWSCCFSSSFFGSALALAEIESQGMKSGSSHCRSYRIMSRPKYIRLVC
jgi:hypothetical protein